MEKVAWLHYINSISKENLLNFLEYSQTCPTCHLY